MLKCIVLIEWKKWVWVLKLEKVCFCISLIFTSKSLQHNLFFISTISLYLSLQPTVYLLSLKPCQVNLSSLYKSILVCLSLNLYRSLSLSLSSFFTKRSSLLSLKPSPIRIPFSHSLKHDPHLSISKYLPISSLNKTFSLCRITVSVSL
jgi:hypothetical protein